MSETILVVDDEKDIANLVAMNLADEGYETHLAHRGDDAMDMALKLRPDLIVLDLMLPGVDGVEVCRQLRKDPRTTTTSIIMLTARNLPSDRIAGLEAGADDYVDKPFDVEELVARVQGRLRRARQLRQSSPPMWPTKASAVAQSATAQPMTRAVRRITRSPRRKP